MNIADESRCKAGQKDLAAGVLKQAEQDLRQFRSATSRVEREIYTEVYRWVTADDYSSPFSFLNVCQLLSLSPDIVRQEALRDASLGFFGYWTRRWLRAARSLENLLNSVFTANRNSTVPDRVPLTTHAFQ